MSYKAKILNPITIILEENGGYILGDDRFLDTPIEYGTVFGTDNYGINIVIKKDENYGVKSYPTTSRIYSVSMENYANSGRKIVINEVETTIPWVFDLEGNLIQQSKFLINSRRDRTHIRSLFESDPDFEIEKFFEESDVTRDKKLELLVWSKILLEKSSKEADDVNSNAEQILKLYEDYVIGIQAVTYEAISEKVNDVPFLKNKKEKN